MDYQLSFSKRMLLFLAVAQLILLAAVFVLGMLAAKYADKQDSKTPARLIADSAQMKQGE
jgi:hypothetical protein